MSTIWKNPGITLEQLNAMNVHTMAEWMNITFTEIGEDYLVATMPVDARVHQPMGLLHGGASAALAETIGSVASWMSIDPKRYFAVGMEINANHIRGIKSGMVTAIARPLHIGLTSHVWDIRINNAHGKLVCISRLTVAIRPSTNIEVS